MGSRLDRDSKESKWADLDKRIYHDQGERKWDERDSSKNAAIWAAGVMVALVLATLVLAVLPRFP